MSTEIEQALQLLRDHEFNGDYGRCVACYTAKQHSARCWLKQAIDLLEEASKPVSPGAEQIAAR